MTENDPHFLSGVLSWVLNAVFTIALAIGVRSYSRSMAKADDEAKRVIERLDSQDKRIRDLERDSVTHEDLRRIENKMDDFTRQVTDRLDRILERSK